MLPAQSATERQVLMALVARYPHHVNVYQLDLDGNIADDDLLAALNALGDTGLADTYSDTPHVARATLAGHTAVALIERRDS